MKKNFSTIVSVITCVMLVFCTMQINNLQKEVNALRRQLDMSYNDLYTAVIDSRGHITNQVMEQLERQNSLFETVQTDIQYIDNQIALTITATPKELKNGERVWASVEVNGQTVQQQFDSNNQATLYFEPVHSVTPILQITSSNGVRQQTLDEIMVINSLATRIIALWDEKILSEDLELVVADIIIEPSPRFNKQTGLVPFTADDIVDAYALIEVSDEPQISGDDYTAGPVSMPKGERFEVELLSANGAKEIIYRADFSEYEALAEDVRYVMHFVVTLSNGLTYCTEGSCLLAFNYGDKSHGLGAGGTNFVPMLDEK